MAFNLTTEEIYLFRLGMTQTSGKNDVAPGSDITPFIILFINIL